MSSDTRRSERVDARRNRQRVLEAADRLLGERGTGVTLGEIAAAAEVGAGTVYRHFPTKEALMAIVVDRRVAQLSERARRAARESEPGEAFFTFFHYAADQALENRALCEALEDRGEWWEPSKPDSGGCVLDEPFAELLGRAQEAGAVRGDVGPRDVMALLPALVTMATALGSAERARQVGAMLWESLRLPVKRNEDFHNETESLAQDRNETRSPSGNETDRPCSVCGGPIVQAGTGRPPTYCSAACRQKAFRRKRKAAALAAPPGGA